MNVQTLIHFKTERGPELQNATMLDIGSLLEYE